MGEVLNFLITHCHFQLSKPDKWKCLLPVVFSDNIFGKLSLAIFVHFGIIVFYPDDFLVLSKVFGKLPFFLNCIFFLIFSFFWALIPSNAFLFVMLVGILIRDAPPPLRSSLCYY